MLFGLRIVIEGQLFNKRFPKISYNRPIEATINLRYQGYNVQERHSYKGGNGRPTVGVENQKQIQDMFKAYPRRSLRGVGAVVGVYHTTVCHFLRNNLKLFPYHLQFGRQLSETDKEKQVAFAQLCKKRLQENQNFLKRIVFFDECSLSLHGTANKKNCTIWGSQNIKTVYESPQSSPTLMVWCAISKNEVVGHYVYTTVVLLDTGIKGRYAFTCFPRLPITPPT